MKRTPLFLVLLTLALALLPSCTPPGGGADAKPVIYLYPEVRPMSPLPWTMTGN